MGTKLRWPSRQGQPDRPASENGAKIQDGIPRNLGDPVCDQSKQPKAQGYKRARLLRRLLLQKSEQRSKDWSEQANQISEFAVGTGSLSALIVLKTPGNAVRADPDEGRGASS
jgi:hypothetical protein